MSTSGSGNEEFACHRDLLVDAAKMGELAAGRIPRGEENNDVEIS